MGLRGAVGAQAERGKGEGRPGAWRPRGTASSPHRWLACAPLQLNPFISTSANSPLSTARQSTNVVVFFNARAPAHLTHHPRSKTVTMKGFTKALQR